MLPTPPGSNHSSVAATQSARQQQVKTSVKSLSPKQQHQHNGHPNNNNTKLSQSAHHTTGQITDDTVAPTGQQLATGAVGQIVANNNNRDQLTGASKQQQNQQQQQRDLTSYNTKQSTLNRKHWARIVGAKAIVHTNDTPGQLPPAPAPPLISKLELYSDPEEVFHELDQLAINVAKEDQQTFTDLVHHLTRNCLTDVEKARAIFRWITVKNLNTMQFDATVKPGEYSTRTTRTTQTTRVTISDVTPPCYSTINIRHQYPQSISTMNIHDEYPSIIQTQIHE